MGKLHTTGLTVLVLAAGVAVTGCSSSKRSNNGFATAAATSQSTGATTTTSTTTSGPGTTAPGGTTSGTTGSTTGSGSTGSTGGSSGSTTGGGSGGSSTAPTSSASTPPTAPPPAAPTTPDTEPPLINLIAPIRGQFTTQTQVQVTGTITDQTGVAYFLVNGNPVVPGPGGMFSETVTLTPGMNVIRLEAADPLAHQVRSALSVISGQFLPEASVVPDAVVARLNRPAFDAIERIAAQQLGGVNLGNLIMAQNPLFQGGGTLANITANATQASFGTPVLDLDPQAGGLNVDVDLPAIDVTVRVQGRVLGLPYSVTTNVTSTNANVTALAVVTIPQPGQVVTQLQNVNVTLTGFRFDINNVPTFLENLLRNTVRRLLEDQIENQVETVIPREINNAIAGANGPITQTVLGRQVTLHVIPTRVGFDVDGADVVADGDMTMPTPAGVSLPTTPGSLSTPSTPPVHPTTGPTAKGVYVSANDDLLNRVGHAAWRGGLMNLKVDQAMINQQVTLPAGLQLDAFLLMVFFPQLTPHLNATDPLELEISSLTPPTFTTQAAPGLLEAGIGDLTLKIFVAPVGGTRQLVLETGLQVKVGVTVALTAQNTLTVGINGRPTIVTDVHTTPLAPMNQIAVETLIDFVAPPVLQILARSFSGFPLPTYPGLQPTAVDILRDGPQNDYVTVRGDL